MERNRRKVFIGKVIKSSVDKMCTVVVERDLFHPIYKKRVKKSKKYLVDDQKNEANINDTVEIMSIRPVSKRKTFRLSKIVRKAININTQGED